MADRICVVCGQEHDGPHPSPMQCVEVLKRELTGAGAAGGFLHAHWEDALRERDEARVERDAAKEHNRKLLARQGELLAKAVVFDEGGALIRRSSEDFWIVYRCPFYLRNDGTWDRSAGPPDLGFRNYEVAFEALAAAREALGAAKTTEGSDG